MTAQFLLITVLCVVCVCVLFFKGCVRWETVVLVGLLLVILLAISYLWSHFAREVMHSYYADKNSVRQIQLQNILDKLNQVDTFLNNGSADLPGW